MHAIYHQSISIYFLGIKLTMHLHSSRPNYSALPVKTCPPYVEMIMMEKMLQAPVMIFCPMDEMGSLDPNCMKMEKMFHRLRWKKIHLMERKVVK